MQYDVAFAQSAQLGMPAMSNPHGAVAFKPVQETKKIDIDESHQERTILIGADLSDQ